MNVKNYSDINLFAFGIFFFFFGDMVTHVQITVYRGIRKIFFSYLNKHRIKNYCYKQIIYAYKWNDIFFSSILFFIFVFWVFFVGSHKRPERKNHFWIEKWVLQMEFQLIEFLCSSIIRISRGIWSAIVAMVVRSLFD